MPIKPYVVKCTQCGATADVNSKQGSGWTIVPEVVCADCNGHNSRPFFEVKSTEKGKVIRIPYNGGSNGQK